MSGMTNVAALLDAWRNEVSELTDRYAQPALASITTNHIKELEKALRNDFDQPLTLREAAKVSGFTEDHIGRLVRQGKIANLGRTNAPRVRRGDLPTKVGASDLLGLRESSRTLTVSPTRTQIAQAVIDRT